jgi:tryptophan synthase alpha chain
MSGLDAAFAGVAGRSLPGVIPYVTAGFPRLDDTPSLLLAAERAGCIAAEVGVPFSDPIADGPTIQSTGTRALALGMTPQLAIEQISLARAAGVTIPLAIMVYVNLVMARGIDAFVGAVASAGADALIIPDLPAGESAECGVAAGRHGLALIPMVAPTTSDARIADACAHARGFIYCVGVTGITGARQSVSPDALSLLDRVRAVSPLPRALGFGISRHQHLQELAGHTEAVVVGSALLEAIDAGAADPAGAAERFLTQLAGHVGASR